MKAFELAVIFVFAQRFLEWSIVKLCAFLLLQYYHEKQTYVVHTKFAIERLSVCEMEMVIVIV